MRTMFGTRPSLYVTLQLLFLNPMVHWNLFGLALLYTSGNPCVNILKLIALLGLLAPNAATFGCGLLNPTRVRLLFLLRFMLSMPAVASRLRRSFRWFHLNARSLYKTSTTLLPGLLVTLIRCVTELISTLLRMALRSLLLMLLSSSWVTKTLNLCMTNTSSTCSRLVLTFMT